MTSAQRATEARITVIGGGLAGAEAAWQAAQRGVPVTLYEMRPTQQTPAHVTDRLAELVCSNSLGSNLVDRPLGLLKAELRKLGSLIVAAGDATSVPAGGALAVGREAFAEEITARIEAHPLIELCREEVTSLPQEGTVILATGPLTSARMSDEIRTLTGNDFFYFYDAMAPIIALESIDFEKAFRGSRYGKDAEPGTGGDYINCPMNQAEYDAFVEALLAAKRIPLRSFEAEDQHFFEACLPVEVIAERGHKALAFGPMRPVGLRDPRTGQRPYAVVQLRQDNLAATLYNMVGFQTNLRWGEQERVFQMIPGLQEAEFVRFGQMHRNTYIHAPNLLEPTMAYRGDSPGESRLFFAGQITGTEGYIGSTTSGYVAGLNAARLLKGQEPLVFPPTTMVGALCRYVTTPQKEFQPMKANYGLLPPLETRVRKKRERHQKTSARALRDLEAFMAAASVLAVEQQAAVPDLEETVV